MKVRTGIVVPSYIPISGCVPREVFDEAVSLLTEWARTDYVGHRATAPFLARVAKAKRKGKR